MSISSALAAGFIILASSPVGAALGVTKIRDRGVSLYHASFWFARAQLNNEGYADIERTTYGSVLGLDKDGQLIIKFADGRKFIKKAMKLADVRLIDARGAAVIVNSLRSENAKFEEYSDDQVVVWINDEPLNVRLIEAGVARPDPTPPTNIVDKAFAIYYWRKFYGTDS